ncbi:MAG: heparin lyase I family protein [Bacteroidota bacterium]
MLLIFCAKKNEITGIGSNVLRLEVRSTDALTSNSIRSEIVPDDESHPLDVDRWYGFKMYLKDWIEDDDSPESVWQWHPNSTTGSGSLSLWAHDGRFTVVTNPGGLGANTYDDIGPTLSDEWG